MGTETQQTNNNETLDVMQPGTKVKVKDTTLEIYRPNDAVIIRKIGGGYHYLIEMTTGVQWVCPAWRLNNEVMN